MRLPERLILALALVPVLSTLSLAQAPARTSLTGTWVRTVPWQARQEKAMMEVDTLVLRPDSTWELKIVDPVGGEGYRFSYEDARWFLSSDTLWFGPPVAPQNFHGFTVMTGYLPNKVSLHNQELTIEVAHAEKGSKVYKRAGP